MNECKPLGQVPFEESTTPVPEDPYGIAKYAAELDLRAARDMFGLDFVVVRLDNVYGPGRGLHSLTCQLNVSTLCGIGGAFRVCLGGV